MMTRRRAAAIVACAIAAVAGSVATGAGAAPAPLLPTVRCPLETALDTVRTPRVAARERASVPAALAGRLAIYVGGPERVVAPRGWRCSAIAAVNGGTVLVVEPRGGADGVGVRSWRERACVGCIYDAACAFLPRAARPLSVGVPCPGLAAGTRVTRLSSSLARFRDADGETGLVSLDAGAPEAAGVSCRVSGAGVCAAILAAWEG